MCGNGATDKLSSVSAFPVAWATARSQNMATQVRMLSFQTRWTHYRRFLVSCANNLLNHSYYSFSCWYFYFYLKAKSNLYKLTNRYAQQKRPFNAKALLKVRRGQYSSSVLTVWANALLLISLLFTLMISML